MDIITVRMSELKVIRKNSLLFTPQCRVFDPPGGPLRTI